MFNNFPILPFDDFAADEEIAISLPKQSSPRIRLTGMYVRKIRGRQGGNDVSLLRWHLFPYCILWRTCIDEGREGFEGAQRGYNRYTLMSRSWHVQCADFYIVCIYFKLHICVQCSFCQLKKGCTLQTRWLINTFDLKKSLRYLAFHCELETK